MFFKPDKMINSETEISPVATLNEQLAKQSQEHERLDIRSLTPSKLPELWLRIDETIAKVFSEEIMKVLLFGFISNTITFRRDSGVRISERIVCASSLEETISSIDIVDVSQFHEWRINRVEKLVTKYLKDSGWDVRDVNVFWDEDKTYISIMWDFKLPEESDEKEVTEVSQEQAEIVL